MIVSSDLILVFSIDVFEILLALTSSEIHTSPSAVSLETFISSISLVSILESVFVGLFTLSFFFFGLDNPN